MGEYDKNQGKPDFDKEQGDGGKPGFDKQQQQGGGKEDIGGKPGYDEKGGEQ